MEMNQIEAFVTIADAKGFSRAAVLLHLSQPAISRRINLLETELGGPLFERIHSGVVLTAAGETFLPFARRILATVADSVEALQSMQEKAEGTIRLAMVGTLANTNLTHKLLAFRQAYPQTQLQLCTARSSEVSKFVQTGEVHFGLRYFADPNQEIVSRLVEHEALVVVCSASSGVGGDVDDAHGYLRKTPCVSFPLGQGSSGEPFARVLESRLAEAELSNVEILAIDSLTAQKRLIEAGFGWGLLPVSSIQEELRLQTLERIDVPALQTQVPVMMIFRKEGYLSQAAEILLAEITLHES